MNENNSNNLQVTPWQKALEQIFDKEESIYSSRTLRKYFYARLRDLEGGKIHNEMADVYGQIVLAGAFNDYVNVLTSDGYLECNTASIAKEVCLSERRVRYITDRLYEFGLIDKKTIPGGTNIYKVIPEKFDEILQYDL
jgi:hypothetical protein